MSRGSQAGYILCVVIFTTCQLLSEGQVQPVVGAAPVLSTHKKDLRLSTGANTTIRCTGNEPVAWLLPIYTAQYPPIMERMNISGRSSSDVYEVELSIWDMMYADTGRYICYYENAAPNTTNATIYIYVADHDHLLAPPSRDSNPSTTLGIFQIVHQGTQAIIACRPTSPSVTVRLFKGQEVTHDNEVSLSDDLTFDSEEGFKVHYPNDFYEGIFHCQASDGNRTEKIVVILSYKASTAAPLPELESSHTNVLVGENMTFRCFVRVAPGVIVGIDWSYSSNEHSDRIRITETTKKSLTNNRYYYDEVESTLTVRSVRMTDRGVYRCTVTNHDGKSASVSKAIRVNERSFVYLTPMESPVEVRQGMREVYLTMQIFAYPPPSRLIWYKDDQPIDLQNRHYDIRIRSDRAKLKIYEPNRSDAGYYMLEAYSADMNTSETMELHLLEPPTVNITPSGGPHFYIESSSGRLTCVFNGFPSPTMLWNWQPCLAMGCQPDQEDWTPVTVSRNIPDPDIEISTITTPKSTLSILSFREAGFYQCTARNKEGAAETDKLIYVTDVDGGFGITKVGDQYPIEGDPFTLSCHANRLYFLPPQLFWQKQNTHILLTNRTGLTITYDANEYSEITTVTINPIAASDIGRYYCRTEDSLGKRYRKDVQVFVRPQRIPRFVKPLDGTIYLKTGMQHTLECNADGLPTPRISWYLEGKEVTPQEHVTFNNNKTRLMFESISKEWSGVYMCQANNRVGTIVSSMTIRFALPNSEELTVTAGLSAMQIAMIVCIIFGMVLLSSLVAIVARRTCMPRYSPDEYLLGSKCMFNPNLPIDEQTESIPYDPRWEFPQDKLHFGVMLGQGAFGKVIKAEAVGIVDTEESTPVAVKMPRDFSDMEQLKALVSELKVLIHVGNHLNIVNLLGACTRNISKGDLYVIVEYCCHGNLRTFLHHRRNKFIDTMDELEDYYAKNAMTPLESSMGKNPNYINTRSDGSVSYDDVVTKKDLVCYAFQIARGMEYLGSRKYIHRDLAARNILLATDNVVKIADFGLAKDCYKYDAYTKKTDGPVPVKWMALESLTHKIYTSRSDVWSFGILLWEMFTVGGNPYPGLEIDETFVEKLNHGYRMQIPDYASEDIYDTMLQCWSEDPEDRPNFSELAEFFGSLLQASVKQHYIDLNTQYLLIQDSSHNGYLRMQGSASDYLPMSDPDSKGKVPNDGFMGGAGNVDVGDAGMMHQARRGSDLSELEALNETAFNNNHSPKGPRKRELSVNLAPDGSVKTMALVHNASKDSPTDSDQSQDEENTNLHDPFLSRSDSDRSERELGLRRGRKGYKCNDSLTSDTSSGFHSDYIPDDSAPLDYNLVMRNEPEEVMV